MSTLSFPQTILDVGTGQGEVPVLIFPSPLMTSVNGNNTPLLKRYSLCGAHRALSLLPSHGRL